MMKSQRIGRRLLVAAVLCLATAMAAAQQYNMVPLGVLGSSAGSGLNNQGDVVGYDELTDSAFRYSSKGWVTPFGAYHFGANAINNSGQIAMYGRNPWVAHHAYISGSVTIPAIPPNPPYTIPYFVDLGTLSPGGYSQPYAINDSGTIVGESNPNTSVYHAFSWSYATGIMSDLGSLGTHSSARGINAAGQIVGHSYTVAGYQRAFLMVNGTMTDMDPANPNYDSYATGINDVGQIVVVTNKAWRLELIANKKWKWTAYRGSYWYTLLYNSNGTSADLGNLGATLGTYGLGMNNGGDVVGMTNLASGVQHAFLYHGGVMGDLNSRVNNIFGWTLLMATNINDFGEIVCFARGPDGTGQAVVLFPVPVGV